MASTDILRIIEGGLNDDKSKIVNYAARLAEKIRAKGDAKLADCINEELKSFGTRSGKDIDSYRTAPIDPESNLQILDVYPDNLPMPNTYMSTGAKRQISKFIDIVTHGEELEKEGMSIPKTLLLYGPSGCGKTTIAHYISSQTRLPLVVSRLDSFFSPSLGTTAKNIRDIFSYAESTPCILFIDELDAVAGKRNETSGELSSLTSILLQNIDSLPSSCVLIVATNRPESLDQSVWRRFTTKVEIGRINDMNRKLLILEQVNGFNCPFFFENGKGEKFMECVKDLTPSDIVTLFKKLKAKAIINGVREISYAFIFSRYQDPIISVAISDFGIGIVNSVKGAYPNISGIDAINKALEYGFTVRSTDRNMGYGLTNMINSTCTTT